MNRRPLILFVVPFALGLVSCQGDTTARRAVSEVTIVSPPSTVLTITRGNLVLVARVSGSGGGALTDRQVIWTSSDTSVATVASTGTAGSSVSPVGPGTVRCVQKC